MTRILFGTWNSLQQFIQHCARCLVFVSLKRRSSQVWGLVLSLSNMPSPTQALVGFPGEQVFNPIPFLITLHAEVSFAVRTRLGTERGKRG